MKRRQRAYAYIINQRRLLVFRQPAFPEAGIQVPAGTIRSDESPAVAVMREAEEETGLCNLQLVSDLGGFEKDMTEFGTREIQDARFFRLHCPGQPSETWSHDETSGGTADTIRFDFFWASFPNDLPELIALNGAMLAELEKDIASGDKASSIE